MNRIVCNYAADFCMWALLDAKGLEAARNWWFDLYWLRKPMEKEELDKVKCDILVVEGDKDPPYDRQVGEQVVGEESFYCLDPLGCQDPC